MLSFDKFKVWDAIGVWCSGVVWFGEEWWSGVGYVVTALLLSHSNSDSLRYRSPGRVSTMKDGMSMLHDMCTTPQIFSW